MALNIVYRRTPAKRKAVVGRAQEVLVQQKITGIERTLGRWFSDKQDTKSLQRIEFIKEWLTKVDPLGYGRTYRLFATSDDAFIGRLHQLRMPVLYLTGEKDPNSTPQMSMMMAQETPNGLAEVVANEAHMMAYISPEKINPIVDRFLGHSL